MQIVNLCTAAVALAAGAAAHYEFPVPEPLSKRDGPTERGCASVHSEHVYNQVARIANKDKAFGREAYNAKGLSSCSRPITVDTYFHAAVPKNQSSTNFMSEAQMRKQIDVMNAAYGPHDIQFNLINITRIADDRITDFTYSGAQGVEGSPNKALEAYWKQTRFGDYKSLNIWFYSSTDEGLLGICSFPDSTRPKSEYWLDGCHVDGNTMPGGKYNNYNLGGTATHETGHWFGLFHVFQDQDCLAPGDLVADTPPQKMVTSGCPKVQDSCPQPGVDSIHNYMDYSYDTCYEEFTEGQENRMHNLFNNIRAVMW